MKRSVGLDINVSSIRLVALEKKGDRYKLVAAGTHAIPPKALASNLPTDQEAIAAALKQLTREANLKYPEVTVALPDTQVFTRVIQVPQLSRQELASAIKWEAEQHIPMPMEQVNLDYTVLRSTKDGNRNMMEVLLVAAPKALIEKYVNYVDLAEIDVAAVETEIIAAYRSIVRSSGAVRTPMIVHLGEQSTSLAIVHEQTLVFTRSMNVGADAFIRATAQNLSIDHMQATEYLKAYGIQQDKLEGKILEAVQPILTSLKDEIQRAFAFFQEKYQGSRVDSIFLGGTNAMMPGLIIYMAQSLNIEAQLANPWIGIDKDAKFAHLDKIAPEYAIAVGLALR